MPPTIGKYRNLLPHPNRISGGLRLQGSHTQITEPGRPLVSIVSIVFNAESTLDQTIQSVLNQTYDNIEYIIIDGGSTDGTLDIIHKYNDKIAYWISEPDEGIGDAFNKGITTSTGDIIGMINADDWYDLNTVETIVNEYIRNGDYIYHAKLQYWDSVMKPYYIFSGDDSGLLKRGTINHPTVFVPRKIYETLGLFNTDFKNAMDYEWLIRAKLKGTPFYYIDKITANMRLDGTSDKKWMGNYIEIYKARKLHGIPFMKNVMLSIVMIVITLCRKSLEHLGLHGIVRIYRKLFSITKKDIS